MMDCRVAVTKALTDKFSPACYWNSFYIFRRYDLRNELFTADVSVSRYVCMYVYIFIYIYIRTLHVL